MDRHDPQQYDAIVVGARCAGAATAMLLARQGLDVLVVDRADLPSDTLSTHSIARGGVVQLNRWGVLDDVLASGAPPIRRVSFVFADGEIVREIKDKAGVDHLLAPRRHILDDIVLSAAIEAGAAVETGVSVTGTPTDATGRVTGVTLRDRDGRHRELRARLVVGADGIRSRIARSVGAQVLEQGPPSSSLSYTYVARPDWDGFEFHIGDGTFAGVFPTHHGEANVWFCSRGSIARGAAELVDMVRSTSPSLAERIDTGRITAPVRSAAALPSHVLEAAGPGWALVGDAGYHRDPITGHGITDAFRDAELLARYAGAALRGDRPDAEALRAYATERRCLLAPIFEVTNQLSLFPPIDRFIELQKHLSTLIDTEAAWLADLPPIPVADRRTVAA
jgi:2-polyprenyl-6-methoxyphenol hydroxylase-like FAD-dependent oxidoreductase